jgi:hypothetical protein
MIVSCDIGVHGQRARIHAGIYIRAFFFPFLFFSCDIGGPFLCNFGCLLRGCVVHVVGFNMCVVEFKHVSCECVEELFIAGGSSLVMNT